MSDTPDLGTHSWRITARTPDAQAWFNRGLVWAYGFNFEAAVDCFQKAAASDPTCVMAYWGIAYASGCNYNKPWRNFTPRMLARAMKQARSAIHRARAHLGEVTPKEAALLEAIERRFQAEGAPPEAVLKQWNEDYVDAMRGVYLSHSSDPDVAALFADALLSRTPWKLWDLTTGRAAPEADTEEAMAVLEHALAQVKASGHTPHPALLHLYIHLMEMSPHPEKALRAADQLRDLVPDAGHLRHMASHIDILCGHYQDAVVANNRAIAADRAFLAGHREMLEYTLYCAHDIHFKIYAAMLLGQYKTSLEGTLEMQALVTEELLRVRDPPMAYMLESVASVKLHVLIRFGRWRDILEEPFPQDRELYCNTVAMLHYARGIAHANLGQIAEADVERAAFAQAQANLHEHRYMITNNTCADVLRVAEAMLNGEIEYHRGNYERAFEHLREAVYRDDHLEYMEPWGWMMPTRHALGALLLAQGRVTEALAVYRADLGLDKTLYRALQHPNNVWSLRGYVTCLRKLGDHAQADALQPMLNVALARVDVEIGVSCFCAMAKANRSVAY